MLLLLLFRDFLIAAVSNVGNAIGSHPRRVRGLFVVVKAFELAEPVVAWVVGATDADVVADAVVEAVVVVVVDVVATDGTGVDELVFRGQGSREKKDSRISEAYIARKYFLPVSRRIRSKI